jgi:predicted nucleic acid-binding protein
VIFVDTSFFAALLLPKDANHRRAALAVEELGDVRLSDILLTTNNVILETITVARYEGSHQTAVRAAELLYGGTMARVYRTTAEDEAAAVAYLRRHHDQEYSAVDCLSFVVMLAQGITEAFSFDSDFSHHFVMRPGPGPRTP